LGAWVQLYRTDNFDIGRRKAYIPFDLSPYPNNHLPQVLTPLRAVLDSLPVPIVEHIVVDGYWATVVWHSEGVSGKNGADYDMKYAWIMRSQLEGLEGDLELKIVEVIGFYDGQKVTDVFQGYDLAALRNGTG